MPAARRQRSAHALLDGQMVKGPDGWHIGPPPGLIDDIHSPAWSTRCGLSGDRIFLINGSPADIDDSPVCEACQDQAGLTVRRVEPA